MASNRVKVTIQFSFPVDTSQAGEELLAYLIQGNIREHIEQGLPGGWTLKVVGVKPLTVLEEYGFTPDIAKMKEIITSLGPLETRMALANMALGGSFEDAVKMAKDLTKGGSDA